MRIPFRRSTGLLGSGAALLLLTGCGAAADSGGTQPGATAVGGTSTPGPQPVDLHSLNLGFLTVPGELCGNPDDVELRDGLARGIGEWPGYEEPLPLDLSAFSGQTGFDDLDGDGRDEAFLPMTCQIQDSTAAGVVATGVLVVSGASGAPTVLGTLSAQQEGEGNATRIGVRSVEVGEVVVEESFYSAEEGSCCPSGVAASTWRWDGAQLRHVGTEVEHRPALAPQAQLDTCGDRYCYATTPGDAVTLALTAQEIGEFPALAQLAPGVDLDQLRIAQGAGQPSTPECITDAAGTRATCTLLLGDQPWTATTELLDHEAFSQPPPVWILTGLRAD